MLGAPVGSDVERYMHAVSVAGLIRPVPWAARPISARDVADLLRGESGSSPWTTVMQRAANRKASVGGSVFAAYNTGFPWGANDGPVWQGRGGTAAAGVSASVQLWRVRLTAAPILFSAQNSAYPLVTTPGYSPLMSAVYPHDIDLPQRFGNSAYTRVNPGESSIDVALGSMSMGLSTRAEGWGIGETFPAILGPNAGGFPHLYLGTSATGARVPFVGRIAARYLLGSLAQSKWSPVTGPDSFASIEFSGRRRVAVGVVASIMPDVAPGLELGVSRFFHSPWREHGRAWGAWSKPFEGILKDGLKESAPGSPDPKSDFDNQLASLFARWNFPRRGAEASFEYFREDHNWDGRDLAGEPEQNGAVAASLRVVTARRPSVLALLTFEYFSGDVRPIAQQRAQGLLYFHGALRQGHTESGQLLGAPIGPGAVDGQRMSWERFVPAGALRVSLQRWRTRSKTSTNAEGLFLPAAVYDGDAHDWTVDGSVSLTRVRRAATTMLEAGVASAQVFGFSESRWNFYLRASAARF